MEIFSSHFIVFFWFRFILVVHWFFCWYNFNVGSMYFAMEQP